MTRSSFAVRFHDLTWKSSESFGDDLGLLDIKKECNSGNGNNDGNFRNFSENKMLLCFLALPCFGRKISRRRAETSRPNFVGITVVY